MRFSHWSSWSVNDGTAQRKCGADLAARICCLSPRAAFMHPLSCELLDSGFPSLPMSTPLVRQGRCVQDFALLLVLLLGI